MLIDASFMSRTQAGCMRCRSRTLPCVNLVDRGSA